MPPAIVNAVVDAPSLFASLTSTCRYLEQSGSGRHSTVTRSGMPARLESTSEAPSPTLPCRAAEPSAFAFKLATVPHEPDEGILSGIDDHTAKASPSASSISWLTERRWPPTRS